MEQRAANREYTRLDNLKCAPLDGQCVAGAPEVLETPINLNLVLARVHDRLGGTEHVSLSEVAGRYLCEFTYFHSLQRFAAPVLFVHVPPYTDAAPHAVLRERLMTILECVQEQVATPAAGLLVPRVWTRLVIYIR